MQLKFRAHVTRDPIQVDVTENSWDDVTMGTLLMSRAQWQTFREIVTLGTRAVNAGDPFTPRKDRERHECAILEV